jgi:hypothetical protein
MMADGADRGASGTPLHLLKLAVGIDDFDQLRLVRAERAVERGGSWVPTRNHPRRAGEVLAGGSLYWVVRGRIRARQQVIGFGNGQDDSGRRCCLIEVDPLLVMTWPRPWRPFQGWRYLSPTDAPPDCDTSVGAGDQADRLLAELRALGLI